MAQTIGTKKQRQAYFRTLATDHERRLRFHVLDLSGRHQTTLEAPFVEGNIACDVTSSPAVTLTASFYDPGSRIGFEPDVGDYPTYRRRMIRVFVDVRVPNLPKPNGNGVLPEKDWWVPCAVFTGPIVAVSRNGSNVVVTCHDKSALAMGVAWKSRTFKKGRKRTDVVRALLSDAGENRMAVAKGNGRLSKKFEVGKMDKRWPKAKAAMPVGRALFYNGQGVAICRRPASRPQYVVPKQLVLSAPVANREPGQPPNRFQLIGGKPTKKAKKKVRSKPKDLPARHPDNPLPGSGVGRNGKRNIHPKVESNPKIKSLKVANNVARRSMLNAAGAQVEVSFDIVPVPHLEPYDVVLVKTNDGSFRVKLTQYEMDLTTGVMAIGARRRVNVPKGGKNDGKPKK